jgi:hypothetical protein
VEADLQFIPPDRKANAILSQGSPRVRRRVTSPAAQRRAARPRVVVDSTTRRAARADAAVINQWLFEQTHEARPKLERA